MHRRFSLPTKDNLDAFETAITKLSEVVQCATVTGSADYELRIVTRDMHAFDDFLRDRILSLGLVSNIESRIVSRSVKNTTAAPLGRLDQPLWSARQTFAFPALWERPRTRRRSGQRTAEESGKCAPQAQPVRLSQLSTLALRRAGPPLRCAGKEDAEPS